MWCGRLRWCTTIFLSTARLCSCRRDHTAVLTRPEPSNKPRPSAIHVSARRAEMQPFRPPSRQPAHGMSLVADFAAWSHKLSSAGTRFRDLAPRRRRPNLVLLQGSTGPHFLQNPWLSSGLSSLVSTFWPGQRRSVTTSNQEEEPRESTVRSKARAIPLCTIGVRFC
jgi:hypothetical protein